MKTKKTRIENINRKDEPIVLGSYTVYDTTPFRTIRMANKECFAWQPCTTMFRVYTWCVPSILCF